MARISLALLLSGAAGEISWMDELVNSGRCVSLGEAPDMRLQGVARIAPGLPPMLSFRGLESRQHGRFTDSGLMLDDAGH